MTDEAQRPKESTNSQKRPRRAHSGFLTVLLLSVLAFEFSLLAGRFLPSAESRTADMRMRLRYALTHKPRDFVHTNICLVAIDPKTTAKKGRFGAGEWLTRQAFFDQLSFFQKHFKPSVLAYDIVLADTLGTTGRKQRVTESHDRLIRMRGYVDKIAKNPSELVMPPAVLTDISKLAMEQGNALLVMRLLEIFNEESFPVITAYYFRGGYVDPQSVRVVGWTDNDVFGDDPAGDEEQGTTIPYLTDLAIPETDLHWPSGQSNADYPASINAFLPPRDMRDYSTLGYVNCPRDDDRVIRRIPLVIGFTYKNRITRRRAQVFVPSFALIACLHHLGVEMPLKPGTVEVVFGEHIMVHSPNDGDFRIPIDEVGRMYLNFTAKISDFPGISFADLSPPYTEPPHTQIRRARSLQQHVNGNIMMVGVTTQADLGGYPLSTTQPTPLVHIHLTAANNILMRDFIAPLSTTSRHVVMGILFLAFSAFCIRVRSARLAPASALLALLYLLTAYGAVHMSWAILPVVAPITYIGVCSFSVLSYRFFTEERAKRAIRGMFSTMVSHKVLSYLEENPESFTLRGHNADATVFFSDIAGFTGISEQLEPERLTRLLNDYLTPVTDIIMELGGYVDKYVGDGIMAVWGAPYPDPDHAIGACRAALLQQECIAELNHHLKQEYGSAFSVRMGLNSGTVTAGNMGSERKFQYTVMGDVVNMAARLEPANKEFDTHIIIGSETRRHIGEHFLVRRLAQIAVFGKQKPDTIYELICTADNADDHQRTLVTRYETALDQFHNREWQASIAALDALLRESQNTAAQLLRSRAIACKETPPDSSWGGVYKRGSKG